MQPALNYTGDNGKVSRLAFNNAVIKRLQSVYGEISDATADEYYRALNGYYERDLHLATDTLIKVYKTCPKPAHYTAAVEGRIKAKAAKQKSFNVDDCLKALQAPPELLMLWQRLLKTPPPLLTEAEIQYWLARAVTLEGDAPLLTIGFPGGLLAEYWRKPLQKRKLMKALENASDGVYVLFKTVKIAEAA